MPDDFDWGDRIQSAKTDYLEEQERKEIERLEAIKKAEQEKEEKEQREKEEKHQRMIENKENCIYVFGEKKKKWFEEQSQSLLDAIIKNIKNGKNQWYIPLDLPLSSVLVAHSEGLPDEAHRIEITAQAIYEELATKIRQKGFQVALEIVKNEVKAGNCTKFVGAGPTSMTCRCGRGRTEHTPKADYIKSITISEAST